MMKTTLDLSDDLAKAMKAKAASEGMALSAFVEEAVRRLLGQETRMGNTANHGYRVSRPARRRQQAETWLRRWQGWGRRVERHSVDPRSLTEIIFGERR